MPHARAALALLVATALAGVAATPCRRAGAVPDDAAEQVHAAHLAAAPAEAPAAPAPPDADGWCGGAPAPRAHLAPVCPCGCGERDAAPGSALGWALLPARPGSLPVAAPRAPAPDAPRLASLASPGLDHVPLA
jgi:hypothetical protein